MPLGCSRITARDLSWAEPWVIQNQTTLTELRSAKHYANDCIAHHFRSSIILDSESILYPLYHFIYYKNAMYTTFSVVESIPPLTSRRRRPVSFSLPPVVAVLFSPPVVKSYQVPLMRSTQFTFTFTHAQSSSREAIYVHTQFTAHEEHHSSRPTTSNLCPYRSMDFAQYLSQTTAGILALPFAQHTPQESVIRFLDRKVYLQVLSAAFRNVVFR